MKTKDFNGIKNKGPLPDPAQIQIPADIADLRNDFVESASSMLDDLEVITLAYETGENKLENASAIRRILHKIKGEASIVGIDDISDLCHQTESAFEEIPENERPDMLLRFKDWLTTAVENMNR